MEKNIVYGWVSRDKNGKLQLHSHKPVRMKWFGEYLRGMATLPPDQFPEVTW